MREAIREIVDGGMKIFENPKFGNVRVVMREDEPLFVGKDVAEALGYVDSSHAVIDHVDEEDRFNSKTQGRFDPEFGQRGTWLINESGLYSLVMSSRLKEAKEFKRWVTSEVLPSIRKTGGYSADKRNMPLEEYAVSIMRDPRQLAAVFNRMADLQEENEQLRPKADYCDNVLASDNTFTITEIAKDYGWTARRMNDFLHQKRVQYWDGRMWILYAEHDDEGYTKTETVYYQTRDGYKSSMNTKWTQKGRHFIHGLMEKNGYYLTGANGDVQLRLYDSANG